MEIDYSKWNRYKIGEVKWINSRRDHPCRERFVQWVRHHSIGSILEIGPGECIEAQRIRSLQKIRYDVCDVSDVFLENAKKLRFNTIKGEMHSLILPDHYDVIYGCSVLEHSPDIRSTIRSFSHLADRFYLTMFKFRLVEGGLESRLDGNYYTTLFNITELLDEIKKYGNIKSLVVSTEDGKFIPFVEYPFEPPVHHNGDYLSIIGSWEPMEKIMRRHGVNKGMHKGHGYSEVYEQLFRSMWNQELKILEIGVRDGKSSRMWKEYFPNAKFYGIDIDQNVETPFPDYWLFYGDQKDKAFLHSVVSQTGEFDIVIDDASHRFEDQRITYEYLKDFTRKWYVLEDLHAAEEGIPYWEKVGTVHNRKLAVMNGYF